MLLKYEKLKQRIEELRQLRYRDVTGCHRIKVCEELSGEVNPKLPENTDSWEEISIGWRWKGRDKYLWLCADINIPKQWQGQTAVGLFDFGTTIGGNGIGFESLLYIDGKPYQGVDTNHGEVIFKKEHFGRELRLMFRLWSGLEGGGEPKELEHEIRSANYARLCEKADDLYYLADMALKTTEILDKNHPAHSALLTALDNAFLLIDWTQPLGDSFYQSVERACESLNCAINNMHKDESVTVTCIGHTHIDVAWLWRLKHTREKASRSFSSVMRLMELFPDYIFLQTQPQIYAYLKEDFPELYSDIKKRVASGQWETDGAMWVEADCNLSSGESLVRQILHGTQFFKEEFNAEPHYLWLPDVFGYSWALPQILVKSGIKVFMTTKISWNQFNRMPHDTFWWQGIDNSRVLTHFITTPTPEQGEESWYSTYNGELLPKTVAGIWNNYSEKENNKELLLSYGYGDGGGGVTRDMLERRRRLNKLPGLPKIQTDTAANYFNRLTETMNKAGKNVPIWDGELYLEYHRGTYTSQGNIKRLNRKTELLYKKAEWLCAMSALSGKSGGEGLKQGWRILLNQQFHDVLPGSSIREVNEDSAKLFEKAQGIAQAEIDAFTRFFQNKSISAYTLLNDSGWRVSELVFLPKAKPSDAFNYADGTLVKCQAADGGVYAYIENVLPTGFKTIYKNTDCANKNEQISAFSTEKCYNNLCIETPFYNVYLDEKGQFSSLYDKEYKRQILKSGEKGNVLQIFEDKPLAHDAWDIDIFYCEKMEIIEDVKSIEITENGPLRLCVHVEYAYNKSTIAQNIIFYAHNRRIDFETKADYHERHKLVKAAFTVDIRSTYASYDVQYGNVQRPNHQNTSWDVARFESVAHRWVDLSERNYGVSILNDCKYGHDVLFDTMRITLLKAATYPDYNADQGKHEFTYSLYPHSGDFVSARTVQQAYSLNQPLSVFAGEASNMPFCNSFISFNNDNVELDAIKLCENSKYIVVRFHEFSGGKHEIKIAPGFKYSRWCISDLMERPQSEWSNEPVAITVNPYEIITILFEGDTLC